jgi:hypothetical protein
MPEREEILVEVWRQTLVDGAQYVQIDGEKYPVRQTSRRLKQLLTSGSKIMNFADSNRTPTLNRNRQRWRVKVRR